MVTKIESTKNWSAIKSVTSKMGKSIRGNFLFATLNFVFIAAFIQCFTDLFGGQNTVIAIIAVILMGICAGKNVAAAPMKHFFVQLAVFGGMTIAACYSVSLGAWPAIPINFAVIFGIVYAYTFEYSNHLYFPYLLSYLFLLFISPVSPEGLPIRLLSVVFSSACMILYALVLHYRNIRKPVKKTISALLGEASLCVKALQEGQRPPDCSQKVRSLTYDLSAYARNRRRGKFELSFSAKNAVACGRATQALIACLREEHWTQRGDSTGLWRDVSDRLEACRAYAEGKRKQLPPSCNRIDYADEDTRRLYEILSEIELDLTRSQPERPVARKLRQRLPRSAQWKIALGYSPVRLVYALRAAILLTLFIIPVQSLQLAHGKWLIFTLASVSLPYADDVKNKGVKRTIATLIGGAIATVCFSLISDSFARTAIMMLSGYLSYYFAGYTGNYACATVGALGGAVATSFGWGAVASVFAIRLGYILLGVAIAYVANVWILPYRRRSASEEIYRKYDATARLLIDCATQRAEVPFYYDLVVANDLLEKKLTENALKSGSDLQEMTSKYRKSIAEARREAERREFSEERGKLTASAS